MINPSVRDRFDSIFCFCISKDETFIDDGKCVSWPTRIGGQILLYGRRKSYFPFHCMVGPDWIIVAVVYFLIIAINSIVLGVISPLGWPPVLIGLVGTGCLLATYSSVACSDPGIIYKNDFTPDATVNDTCGDIEDPVCGASRAITDGSSAVTTPPRAILDVPNTMDCGQCEFKRPYSARHCTFCEVCVDELDHHCPWCGKCIGDLTIKAFYRFLNVLCFQFYYLTGTLVYYLIFSTAYGKLPHGPSFR